VRVYIELRAVVNIGPALERDLRSGAEEPLNRLTEAILHREFPLEWTAVDYIEPCSQVDTPESSGIEPGLSRLPAQKPTNRL